MTLRTVRFLLMTLGLAVVVAGCSDPEQRAAKYIDSGMQYLAQGQYEKARVEFKNAGRIKPTDPEIRYRLALVDEAQGNLRAAFVGFREAENQNPRFRPALLKLAEYYMAGERYGEVEKRLAIVAEDAPDDPGLHAIRAALHLRRGEHSAAETEARAALAKDPGQPGAIAVLTGLYTATDQPEKAVDILEEGIRRHPRDISLLQLRVTLYRKLGDVDKAAAAYDALFALRPNDAGLRAELGRMLVAAKRPDQAEKALRDGVAAQPGNPQMKSQLIAFLNEVRGTPAAEAQVRAFIKAEPDNNAYSFWLAEIRLRQGDVDGAVATLDEVISRQRTEPGGLAAKAMLAQINLGRGDRETAERLIAEVLARAPTNPEALYMRASLAFEKGDTQSTVTDIRTILRDNPRAAKVYQLLAEALLQQGRLDLAIETLSQFLELDPGNRVAKVRLAQLHHINGDTNRALAMLAAVTEAEPDFAVAWETRARIAIETKDWQSAEAALARLASIEGQARLARYLHGEVLANTGKAEEAAKVFTEVIDADPNDPIAERAVIALVPAMKKLGRTDEATKYLDGLDLTNPAALTVLAEAHASRGRLDRAAATVDKAIAQSPARPEPYVLRARLYITENQRIPAVDILQRGIAAAPADLHMPMMLADLYSQMDRVSDAIALYENVLQRNPSLDIAANNMAQLIADHQYADPAALEKARRVAERFIQAQNPLFQDTLAWVYVRQGQYEQALPILARVTATANLPRQIHYHYGKALALAGDKAAARKQLELAVRDGRPYPGLEDARQLLGTL